MYVFLDESGTFERKKDKYFIVGSYTVGDRKRVVNGFRSFQRKKFPRILRWKSEVKFSDPRLDDKLRLKMIKHLAGLDIRIFYTFLRKKNIPLDFRKKGRLETGFLYVEIIGETLQLYTPVTDFEFRVFRDHRPLKGISKTEFNKIVERKMLPHLPAKSIFRIEARDSSGQSELQVADWICGALARYHEKKDNGEKFYALLKNNIIQAKELFPDYWDEKWSNKK